MKIAIVANPYIPVPPLKYGGTERVIDSLIHGLKEAGHEPILLASGDSKVNCELVAIVGKSIFFPAEKKDLPSFKRKVQSINKNIEKEITKLLPRIDLIHSHDFDLWAFKDFPNVTTIHGPINFEQLQYYFERKALNYVTISKDQQLGFPTLNYAGVVYNGEDSSQFPIIRRPQNYVCFVGRFDHEKNPHLAIQLAINLGLKIKLVGKLDFLGSDYFEEEIKPYLKHPLVEYLGELNQKDVVKVMAHAKCNLHPTGFREPFGLTVLEAAYCGTPTMAIARGSMPELIREGRTGMLVQDFVEGYHHIEECFKMDREYIARRSRHLFNYTNMTKGYLKAYKKVLSEFKK